MPPHQFEAVCQSLLVVPSQRPEITVITADPVKDVPVQLASLTAVKE